MDTSQSILLSALTILGAIVSSFFFASAISKVSRHRALLALVGASILIPSVIFFLALNPWITDPRYRTFHNFYYDIDKGMSREEVLKALLENYPRDGSRERPIIMSDDDEKMGFFMNSEENTPLAEGIFLKMKNGVVASKTYSND